MAKNILDDGMGPLAKAMANVLDRAVSGQVAKAEKKKTMQVVYMADPNSTVPLIKEEEEKEDKSPPSLRKSILNVLNGGNRATIARLAFEADPTENTAAAGVFQRKAVLLPDDILKRIVIQDNLVAAIVNARCNHLASFGRRRPDRFSTGFVIEPMAGIKEKMSPDEKKKFDEAVTRAERKLTTCGATEFFGTEERYVTFSQFLWQSTRSALSVGRIATEIIWRLNAQTGEKEFHAFRAADAGTIYKCIDDGSQAENIRKEARLLIERLRRKQFKEETKMPTHFDWVQVIKGKPVQVFTDKELAVHNFYPVVDVELNGYPVTPLDTVMNAVTTHLNIEEHNKLYFQSGRAARGMLLIQSDDVDEGVIQNIKQQFQASINSVQNAWRMPVFGLGKEDSISWTPIDSGSRDMEFQYLSDSNARTILSAFQMSPEELPGYAHLSRGTNSQALSEGNNEYKLEAARDVGLRPLISQFEDFINARIFPLIDPKLAKICTVKLLGLDAETAEKESVRLQQDMALHMTYDQVLGQVEKKPMGMQLGGEYPLNPQVQAILEKFLTKGEILEKFFGVEGASKKPEWAYCIQDPVDAAIFQMKAQAAVQAQMQAQQPQQPPGGGDGGGGAPPPQGGGDASGGQQAPPQQGGEEGGGKDLSSALEQVIDSLSKNDKEGVNLPPSRRRLFAQQKAIVRDTVKHWEEESKKAIAEIVREASKHGPKE